MSKKRSRSVKHRLRVSSARSLAGLLGVSDEHAKVERRKRDQRLRNKISDLKSLRRHPAAVERMPRSRIWGDDTRTRFRNPAIASDAFQRLVPAVRNKILSRLVAAHAMDIALEDAEGNFYFLVQRPMEITVSFPVAKNSTITWTAHVPQSMQFSGEFTIKLDDIIVDFDPRNTSWKRNIKRRWDRAIGFTLLGSFDAKTFSEAKKHFKTVAKEKSQRAVEAIDDYKLLLAQLANAVQNNDNNQKKLAQKVKNKKTELSTALKTSLDWLWFLTAIKRQPDPNNKRSSRTMFKDLSHSPIQKARMAGDASKSLEAQQQWDQRIFWGVGASTPEEIMQELHYRSYAQVKRLWFPAIYANSQKLSTWGIKLHPANISKKLAQGRALSGDVVGRAGNVLRTSRFAGSEPENSIFIINRARNLGIVRADTYLTRFDSPMKHSALIRTKGVTQRRTYGPKQRFVHGSKIVPQTESTFTQIKEEQ